jgi:hypothetical protein
VVEVGTHRELYLAKGLYHTLFEEQSRRRDHAATGNVEDADDRRERDTDS